MTSSILPPRSVRGPWAPSTHATASTRFDLPEPFGPTTTVTPGSNSSSVLSAKDLKPRSVSDFRNTSRAPRWAGFGLGVFRRIVATPPPGSAEARNPRSAGRQGHRRVGATGPRSRIRRPGARRARSTSRDAGTWWPLVAPADERVDRRRVALEHGLDPPVGEVADPAGDTAPQRLLAARLAEPDPLHRAPTPRRGASSVTPGRPRRRRWSGRRPADARSGGGSAGRPRPSRAYTLWWCWYSPGLAEEVDVLLVGE